MRELMLENAGGEWNRSLEGFDMLVAGNVLGDSRQPFPDRCRGGKCKDRACSDYERRITTAAWGKEVQHSARPLEFIVGAGDGPFEISDQPKLPSDLPERCQRLVQIGPRVCC
jgi:hypothetical protein